MAFFFGRNINNRNINNNRSNNNLLHQNNTPPNNNQLRQNINNNNLNNNNHVSNLNNNTPPNNSDINQGVNFQPLTEEDLLKINEEIQENIKQSQQYLENKKASNTNNFNNNLLQPPTFNPNSAVIISYLHDFIQSEKNSHAFYKNLADTCSIKHYKQKFTEISNDCQIEQRNLEAYLVDFHKENSVNTSSEIFKPLDIDIFPISNLREGVMLAVEEEIKYYDKLSKIVEDLPPKDTRIFYAMALRKLGRINNIQYVFLRL